MSALTAEPLLFQEVELMETTKVLYIKNAGATMLKPLLFQEVELMETIKSKTFIVHFEFSRFSSKKWN
ncbi:hypothetical protein [Nostoc sp.]|uniref:hypothetical protein n=1 Tax=Nostoc sp. TaxID=1180 RepID=UPI003FA5E34D